MSAIQTFADLQDRIAALPAPAPGLVRVFRGQRATYPTIVPSGLRSLRPVDPIVWQAYSFHIAQKLLLVEASMSGEFPPDASHAALEDRGRSEDLLRTIAFGVQALTQHYGPGSSFLDVTHALHVAAWFALNEAELYGSVRVPRDMLEILQNPEAIRSATFMRYRRHSSGPGWLYVFDARPWTGEELPRHGDLVDLGAPDAPRVLAQSTRIRKQQACLLAAESSSNGGDLCPLMACPPIPIDWPMADLPARDDGTADLFPSAGADVWYERLLSIPKAPHVDGIGNHIETIRPLPVTLYGYDDVTEHERTFSLERTVQTIHGPHLRTPPLSAALLPQTFPAAVGGFLAAARFSEATRILLEGPVVDSSPPLDSGFWNVDALSEPIDPWLDVDDAITGQTIDRVTSENVYVQLSPLEWPFWEIISRGHEATLLRGIWLVRQGDVGTMCPFYERFPATELRAGPRIAYRFSPTDKALQYWFEQQWRPATGRGSHDTPLVVTLDILRKLDHRTKTSSSNSLRMNTDGVLEATPRLESGRILRLVRFTDRETGDSWHALRTTADGIPYVVASLMLQL